MAPLCCVLTLNKCIYLLHLGPSPLYCVNSWTSITISRCWVKINVSCYMIKLDFLTMTPLLKMVSERLVTFSNAKNGHWNSFLLQQRYVISEWPLNEIYENTQTLISFSFPFVFLRAALSYGDRRKDKKEYGKRKGRFPPILIIPYPVCHFQNFHENCSL